MSKALEDLMQDVIEEREKTAAQTAAQEATENTSKQAAIKMYENNTSVEFIANVLSVSTEKVEDWLGLVTP